MSGLLYTINESEVSHNSFENEVIVIHLPTGLYFSLFDAAAAIWQQLVQGPADGQSLLKLFQNPPEGAVCQVQDFLQSLENHKLILPAQANLKPQQPQQTIPFSTPSLQACDDLQDLLLADIIHDTDENGWPRVTNPDSQADAA